MQLVRSSRDTLLRPLMIVSGIAERRYTQAMAKVFGMVSEYAEEPTDIRAYLNGFIAKGNLLIAGRSRKVLARRSAGLGAQDEPPQQQSYDLCPNCCLRTMLGPAVRAPPVSRDEQRNTGNKKAFYLLQTITPNRIMNQQENALKSTAYVIQKILAERGGFEPPLGLTLNTLSRRATSTTHPPLLMVPVGVPRSPLL